MAISLSLILNHKIHIMLTPEQLAALPETVLIDGDFETREVHIDGKFLRPDKSLSVRNHSPDGFNWGYGGSGPAQLALAILLRLLPTKEHACELYQDFKFKIVAAWPRTDFEERINFRQIITELQQSK